MYGLMVVVGIIAIPFLIGPRSWVRGLYRVWLALVFGGLALICGTRYRVEGLENLPDGGALIASRHQSMMETQAFWRILPDPAIILKQELTSLPFFGWVAMKLGNIKVDRGAGSKALRKMLADARDRAAQGRQVLIFPEGTRIPPGQHADYKPGVAGLYREMGVPCVPVALNTGLYWAPKGIMRRPGCATIQFLPPIPPGLPRDVFMSELKSRIDAASDALLPETLRPR
ncbi:MAG: 1-acyl-sn-glycerol-3-phosphate acyltransferase [Maricaulaceae bacterium]|nr:1-acyl-sn-glycerol-3-phosphate acyltransferase [Maricaulaceae bacterium]